MSGVGLVTCVLNTIDDALDRSDPEGIEWRLPTVKHLDALLDVAATMGRPVILTSDHGHVLERRKGRLELPPGATATSARSRSAEPQARVGELLVEGPRVIGGRAVLAVDELAPLFQAQGRLSRGCRGRRGGGAGGAVMAGYATARLRVCRGPHPAACLVGFADRRVRRAPGADTPVARGTHAVRPAGGDPEGLGLAVVGSAVWERQVRTAGRFDLPADRCAALLDQLAAAKGTRLARPAVARALRIAEGRVSGAVAQLVKVLNVEGYPVLREDAGMVVLDPELLAEQFEVHA